MYLNYGFVKLFRNIAQWRYYKDIPVKTLYIHLLMSATYKDYELKNPHLTIPRGHYYASMRQLAEETGLTIQQVRTALNKLDGEEITVNTVKKKSLIRINNWDIYQEKGVEFTKENDIQIDIMEYFSLQSEFWQKNGRQPNNIEMKKIYSICEFNQVQRERGGKLKKLNKDFRSEELKEKLFGSRSI